MLLLLILLQVSAVVKWDASSDFGDIIEYWIFNGSTLLKKTTGTGDTIVSLKAVTKYTIVVRAKDEIANFSPKSAAVEFNTLVSNVTNLEESGLYKMYPNPARNFVTIEPGKNNNLLKIEIFDCLGKSVYKNSINEAIKIEKSALGNGNFYLVKLSSVNNTSTEKLIFK